MITRSLLSPPTGKLPANAQLTVPATILTSQDDPIIPVEDFRGLQLPAGTALDLNNVAGTVTLGDLDKNGAGAGINLVNVGAAVTVPTGATIDNLKERRRCSRL